VLAVPIRQADGRFLGALSAKITLRASPTHWPPGAGGAGEIYVMTDQAGSS